MLTRQLNRLSLSAMMVAWSVAPAFAGGGGEQDGVGALIVTVVVRTISKLADLF